MSNPDIQTQVVNVERYAQQLATALRSPEHKKQRNLLKEGRALLTRAFRVVEAAKLAAKEAGSSEDPQAMTKVQALHLDLVNLEASLPALLASLASGQDVALPPTTTPERGVREPLAPGLEGEGRAKRLPSGGEGATPPPQQPPSPQKQQQPEEQKKPAPKKPEKPKPPEEPQTLRYFDMVRLKVKPHPAQINAAHPSSLRIGNRALDADDMVEERQQRIDKLMEMVGAKERTTQGEVPAAKPYPEELLPGTSERPLILYPKKKKRHEH
jgi:hypothetical protein